MSLVRKHYGFSALRHNLRPFLIGKGFRLTTSVAVLVLLARYLPQSQYAVYVSLQALVTIVGSVSSIGIQQIMLRYMPELRADGNNVVMYRMLSVGMMLRFAVVSIFMLAGLPFKDWLGRTFGLEAWLWVVPWYATVGLVRLTSLALSQSLEGLLWQKEAQYGMALASTVRLIGIPAMVMLDAMNLWAVTLTELCGEAACLAMLIHGWRSRRSADDHKNEGDLTWWSKNRPRVVRFGLWSGLLNQTRILYGSAPNRLIAAYFLGPAELATLGFADGLTNLARRLMPTSLLMSMIRPIFMAHYSSKQDFGQLVRLTNLVYRLNLSLLALPIVLLMVVGEPLFDWVTAGKYGFAAHILAGFLGLMVIEGMRSVLELLVQAVEKNEILLTNLIQSASLFAAIPLFGRVGLWALVIVNVLGTGAANIIITYFLRKAGYHFRLDLGLSLLVVLYSILSGLAGSLVLHQYDSELVAAGVVVIVFAGCMAVKLPLHDDEKAKLKALLFNQFGSKKKVAV